jgi:hypothetical protein
VRRIAWLGILGAALAGCGAAPAPDAAQTDVAAIAEHYANALAARDWKTVCASRVHAEQVALARTAGSCQRGVALAFKGKSTDVMLNAKAKHIRIKGDVAGLDFAQANGIIRLGRIAAVREDGHWRIANLPDDQIP